MRLLPKWAYPVLFGPLRGCRFILGAFAGDCGGANVYINRVEPEQTHRLMESLKEGQTYFDVGANAGYYTILSSRLVGSTGTVVAFEPSVRNVHYLYRHVCLNRAGNVTIFPGACGESISLELFSQGDNCATGHVGDSDSSTHSDPVAVLSLDQFVERTGTVPEVVKIDVEGAEMDVLRGAENLLRTHRPILFLSTHSKSLREECLMFLSGIGYHHGLDEKAVLKTSEFTLTA